MMRNSDSSEELFMAEVMYVIYSLKEHCESVSNNDDLPINGLIHQTFLTLDALKQRYNVLQESLKTERAIRSIITSHLGKELMEDIIHYGHRRENTDFIVKATSNKSE